MVSKPTFAGGFRFWNEMDDGMDARAQYFAKDSIYENIIKMK